MHLLHLHFLARMSHFGLTIWPEDGVFATLPFFTCFCLQLLKAPQFPHFPRRLPLKKLSTFSEIIPILAFLGLFALIFASFFPPLSPDLSSAIKYPINTHFWDFYNLLKTPLLTTKQGKSMTCFIPIIVEKPLIFVPLITAKKGKVY
jgi:hypothetical protein